MSESNVGETGGCTNMKTKSGEPAFLVTFNYSVVFNQIEIEY